MCPLTSLYYVPQSIYQDAVFLDTSAFIELALKNPDALACESQIASYLIPTYTTTLIIAETHRRLLYDHNENLAFAFLSQVLSSNVNIIRHDKEADTRAKDILSQYWALKLTFADSVSFAVMLSLGIAKSFTYDNNHFQALGFVTYPPFYP